MTTTNRTSVIEYVLFWIAAGLTLCRAEERTCAFTETTGGESHQGAEGQFNSMEQLLTELNLKVSKLEDYMRAQDRRIDVLERRLHQSSVPPSVHAPSNAKSTSMNTSTNYGYEMLPEGPSFNRTLLRHRQAFYDSFQLLSVVKTDGELTALTMTASIEDKKNTDFFLLGDALGKLYAFTAHGDLLSEYDTGTKSPVTELSYYDVSTDVAGLATCHSSGEILVHHIESSTNELDDTLKIERITFNRTLSWNLTSEHPPATVFATKTQSVRKFFVSYDDGRLLLLRANGTILRDISLSSRLFDIRTEKNHVFLGHKDGISMYFRGRVKHLNCTGDEKVELRSVVFDVDRANRAFGMTTEDELVMFTMSLDGNNCKIRHRTMLPVSGHQMILRSTKGYIMLGTTHEFALMNVTLAMRAGPRHVMTERLEHIADAFGFKADGVASPLLSVMPTGDIYTAMHFSSGILAVFHGHLSTEPIVEFVSVEWMYRPLFFLAFIIVIGWRMWKKERGGLFGEDDEFADHNVRRRREMARIY